MRRSFSIAKVSIRGRMLVPAGTAVLLNLLALNPAVEAARAAQPKVATIFRSAGERAA
jgi:hypothetical protein